MPNRNLMCGFCFKTWHVGVCVHARVGAQWAPGVSKTQPEASQINSIHQTRVKRFQRHTSEETSNGRGEPSCPTIDAVKLILTSWGHIWSASAISCIGRTRPFCLGNGMEGVIWWSAPHLSPIWEKKWNVRERLKGEAGWEDCISIWQRLHTCSQAFLCGVIPKSWQRIWAKSGPWENQPIHTHKRVLSVLCQFASISLSLPPSHTLSHTHTTPFSQNTHGGERLVAGNVKLLCHVQSQSGSLTTVCVVGLCACSAKNTQTKDQQLYWSGLSVELRTMSRIHICDKNCCCMFCSIKSY